MNTYRRGATTEQGRAIKKEPGGGKKVNGKNGWQDRKSKRSYDKPWGFPLIPGVGPDWDGEQHAVVLGGNMG